MKKSKISFIGKTGYPKTFSSKKAKYKKLKCGNERTIVGLLHIYSETNQDEDEILTIEAEKIKKRKQRFKMKMEFVDLICSFNYLNIVGEDKEQVKFLVNSIEDFHKFYSRLDTKQIIFCIAWIVKSQHTNRLRFDLYECFFNDFKLSKDDVFKVSHKLLFLALQNKPVNMETTKYDNAILHKNGCVI